ncbi:MAG TPA: hypothetical protein PLK42_09975, partial [Casimicrobium sp.]|nr:hypothetical protein [Casimicrobium sp.]
DVYGLGAVLYFLAMGTPPPQAVTRLMGGSLHAFEESASALYSPTFIDAVKRALAVRPEARLQSVDALREALGWSWARTSELPPTTYIVPPEATTSARNAAGDPAADMKPMARVGERVVASSPTVLEPTVAADPLPSSTQVVDTIDKANAAGAQVRNSAEPLLATRSTSKLKTALIVSVMLMVLAAVAWKFLFKSDVAHTATPPVANPPSATSPSAPAVTPPEQKPEPAAQNVGSSAAPAQSPSTSPSLSGKPTSPNASAAADKAASKASNAPAANAAAPKVSGVELTEDTPRAVTAPPNTKPARPARSPIDPVEPGDSGYDPEVASKSRGTGKTSSEVCERLLAKLSLGTDELTSTERRQLSSCR